ncbi:hypothetical protein KAW38_02365 [Candidatus Micrarchaeota archaeon]|nr:hypothetical protein [Candidatus Micrarchaeota archaeon]
MFGLNDPLVSTVGQKYGDIAGTLWKVSNAAIQLAVIFFVLGVIALVIGIAGLILLPQVQILWNIIFGLGGLLMALFGLAIAIYVLCVFILAIVAKEYLWAVGIFLIGFLAFIYKYLRGKEMK